MLKYIYNYKLNRFKKKGLQIDPTSTVVGMPYFGSEPFLVSIGKNVTVSVNVNFITHDGGTRLIRKNPRYKNVKNVIKFGRVTVHDDCFIGHSCTLLPGVTIGPNSIVAAGSIVTKDVPPNTVFGGVPAKQIMTMDQYAENCIASAPAYDPVKWKEDKKQELLRLFPYPW